MKWTKAEDDRLTRMVATDKWMLSEIAEKLGKKATAVRYRARQLGLNSKPASHKFGQWNNKHAHLQPKLLRYYLTHTATECCKQFKLTPSEFKSCLTAGYRNQSILHLRKDTRTHEPWSLADLLFVLQHAGIQERQWIASKLGRTKDHRYHSIKDKMSQIGGGGTKCLNGMPLTWAKTLWPDDKLYGHLLIKTNAGPTGGGRGNFKFLLLPWIEAERLSNTFVTPDSIKRCIKSMAKFQRFIHAKRDRLIVRQLKQFAGET